MEFLAQDLGDPIDSDSDYFNDMDGDSSGTEIYLVMSSSEGVQQILRLWQRYLDGEDFQHGTGRWKVLFGLIESVRAWDIGDRLSDDALAEFTRLAERDEFPVFVLAELWFRSGEGARSKARQRVESLPGLTVVRESLLPAIGYHALTLSLDRDGVLALAQMQDTPLTRADEVASFVPAPQADMAIYAPTAGLAPQLRATQAPTGSPLVALLDGLPMENHDVLRGRLIVDDPEGLASSYPAAMRRHGTAMASLIVNGDLSTPGEPLQRPLYVRPILVPGGGAQPREVFLRADNLIDEFASAVARLFEPSNGEPPLAPTVKVINLSVADAHRQFGRSMSPWARLLDWLSHRYNVVFVVSAGNHTRLEFPAGTADLSGMTAKERVATVLSAVAADGERRRILSPSESVNSVSVAATHSDGATPPWPGVPVDLLEDARLGLPSPISSVGFGFRGMLKPDLGAPGGRTRFSIWRAGGSGPRVYEASAAGTAPGVLVASPGMAGDLSDVAYSRGTSCAAALVTRHAAKLAEAFAAGDPPVPDEFQPQVIRAGLVHTCSWDGISSDLQSGFDSATWRYGFKDFASRLLGFGAITPGRMLEPQRSLVSLVGWGLLRADEAHEYRVPLPPELAGLAESRRLTVSLASLSPINAGSPRYRVAETWFDVPSDPLRGGRAEADGRRVRRGTLQHEHFTGQAARYFSVGDEITIKVNCREVGGKLVTPVRYGLWITLEVATRAGIDVYASVSARIQAQAQVRA